MSWERLAQIACDTVEMPLFFAVSQLAYLGLGQSIARLAGKISCYSVELESRVIQSSQTARPVTSLIITTITAITNIMWINPPATWNENPRSQRMNKITAIVQSINSSISMFTMHSRALVSPDV
jgi:hypothetical protein